MGEYSRGKCKIGNRRNTQVNPRNTNRNMPKHHGKWQETVRKPGERTIERIIMIITGGHETKRFLQCILYLIGTNILVQISVIKIAVNEIKHI